MKTSVGYLCAAGLLGVSLLSGCAMQGPGNFKVHEALFYGASQQRLAWVYGTLTGGQGNLSIQGQTAELRSQISDPLATPGSLSVGGKAVYQGQTSTLLPPASVVQRGSQYQVSASQNVAATYLTMNGTWYKLSGNLSAGAQVTASLQPQPGLSGGNLTSDEAAVLSGVLGKQGTLVVNVLPAENLPDAPLNVQPAPDETLQTGLYVQPLAATTTTSTTTSGGNVNSTLRFRELASGTNGLPTTPQITLASTQSALNALWRSAYGRQVPVPPVPTLAGQTALGIFLGSRPTGGYSVTVQSVRALGTALEVTVNVRQPGAGTLTTQVITSPWTIVTLPGQFSSATVRDQNGQVLGQ